MAQLRRPHSAVLQLKHDELVLRRHLDAALAAAGITFEQWQLMAALHEEHGLGMTDLAEASALPPATLTRHVDRLIALALVIRRVDPEDRRRAIVALSSGGLAVAAAVAEVEASVDQFRDLPESVS